MPWGDSIYTLPQVDGLDTLLPEPSLPSSPATRYRPEVERLRPWALATSQTPQEAEDWLAGAESALVTQVQPTARVAPLKYLAPPPPEEADQGARTLREQASIRRGGGSDFGNVLPAVGATLAAQVKPLKPVQEVAGDVGRTLAPVARAVPGIGALEQTSRALGGPGIGDVGEFAGRTAIPTTVGEAALSLTPGIGDVPGVISAAKPTIRRGALVATKAAQAATREAITPSPTVLRVAVKEGATAPSVVEGLAASRGAETITDPSLVRVLGPDEAVGPGERELFHGTSEAVEGPLRRGTFLTPNRPDAEAFAGADAALKTRPAAPLRRLATAASSERGAVQFPGGDEAAKGIDEGAGSLPPRSTPPAVGAQPVPASSAVPPSTIEGVAGEHVFHGGRIEGDVKSGVFVSADPSYAEKFASQRSGAVSDFTLTRDLNVYPKEFGWQEYQNIWRKDQMFSGFDAVRVTEPNGQGSSLVILKPEVLRPSSSGAGGGGIPPVAADVAVAADEPAGFAGNIRLSKYPEDLRDLIKQAADDNPGAIQQARRGVRPDVQVMEDARSLVEDLGGNFDKLQKSWKPGDAWNAEEIVAIKSAHATGTRAVADAARLAIEADSTANQLKFAQAILEQQRLQQIVYGVKAEAGRSLRASRQMVNEALTSGDIKAAQTILNRAIGTSDPADISTLAKALKALDEISPAAANKLIRDVNKPNFWDKLHWYWMNSILSGPITQTRNIAGNIGSALYTPVQRVAAAGIEQPLAAMQGRQAQRFWQEAPAFIGGMIQGFPEGVRGAATTLRTGISPKAATKMDIYRAAPIGGLMGNIIGLPTRGLGAADEFFSAINYRGSLWADAQRMARSEGLKGDALTNRIADLVSDPPPALMKQATEEAESLVFRGDPGAVAHAAAYLRQKVPGGRYILPFLNTPANLLKYGVKNSPLGLLDVGAWQKALKGNPEGVDELTRAFMGSSIAVGLGSLVATGALDITAAAPVNSAERDRFFREGKMPFSVKIPGIGWVEYKQIPAMDTTFTLVASVVDGVRRGDDVGGIASQAAANIATNLLDKSYMSGIGDLFDAVQDPVRYAERYTTRHLSGYVPFSGAGRQTAGFVDRTVRSPEGFSEQIQTQIPGLSQNVPPRLTAFGEEARRGVPSPIQVSPVRESAVDAELERLGKEVGFTGKSIAGIPLSREEQADYQREAGQLTKQLLATAVGLESYNALPDLQKEKLIDRLINEAREEARLKVLTKIKEGLRPVGVPGGR